MKRPTRRTSSAKAGSKRKAKAPAKTSRAKTAQPKTTQPKTPSKNAKAVSRAQRAARTRLTRGKRAYDMASASAEMIGYRSAMIGRELASPTGFADPEFAAMGHEKVLAAGQAAAAMLQRLGGSQRIWADFWFQQMRRSITLLPLLAASRSPVQTLQIASVSFGTALSDSFALWTKVTNFSETVLDAGARPFHRVVTGNAKRLARAV
jgi:hypothetical protein